MWIGVLTKPLEKKIQSFYDYYNNKVELSFLHQPFSNSPRHVWVICKYKEDWLMTKHGDRGIEFPGGKIERDETAEEAAIREVFEETGGVVKKIRYLGQYKVTAKAEIVIKNIYFAEINELIPQAHYYETDGPVILNEIPNNIKMNGAFSFIMKDEILPRSLEHIKKLSDSNP